MLAATVLLVWHTDVIVWPHAVLLIVVSLLLAAELEQCLSLVFTRQMRLLLLAQVLTCLSMVSLFLRPWLFFRALVSSDVSVNQLCGLFVLTNPMHVLTVEPGVLGCFEATMAGYTRAVGLGHDKGATFALLTCLADLTFLILVSWLILHYGVTQVARQTVRGGDAGQQAPGRAGRKERH